MSDVAEPGAYVAFDLAGERALVLRGDDGRIRAFHNLCRYRGSRVVATSRGQCERMITCPFHGWRYNLDGTLRGPTFPDSLPKLDRVEYGLKPVDMDIWMGFVFVRFLPGDQPAGSRVLARHDAEVPPYRTAAMVPAAGEFWTQELGHQLEGGARRGQRGVPRARGASEPSGSLRKALLRRASD